MLGERTFKIDALAESVFRYLDRDAIVCLDIICSSTTVVTGVALGRRVFPVTDTDAGLTLATRLDDPLMAGEVNGVVPVGFSISNSPAALARRTDVARPLVLAAPGTSLIVNGGSGRAAGYVACYRNLSATAGYLASNYERIAILGAGVGADFRCEDQMAAAMIGRVLAARGFEPADVSTAEMVERWSKAEVGFTSFGRSAADLRKQGREDDLEFIVSHFDDLDLVCGLRQGEAVKIQAAPDQSPAAVGAWWGSEWGVVVPFGPRGPMVDAVASDKGDPKR